MAEVDEFTERMFSRSGAERVPSRLEGRYGIQVAGLTELDLGVFRVDRQDQAQLGSPARRRRLNEALQ